MKYSEVLMKKANGIGNTQQLATAGLMTALVFIFTFTLKIPSLGNGYVHLGDAFILISGTILPPIPAFFASAVGSSLADLAGGYMIFLPATFVIKGLEAIFAQLVFRALRKRIDRHAPATAFFPAAMLPAVLWMVVGYFIYETFAFGWEMAVAAVFGNIVQGFVSIVLGTVLFWPLQRASAIKFHPED